MDGFLTPQKAEIYEGINESIFEDNTGMSMRDWSNDIQRLIYKGYIWVI